MRLTGRCPIRLTLAVALLIVVGCKKKKPPEKGPDVVQVQKVETPLQITAIDPSTVSLASVDGHAAQVFGSGFEDGATLDVGDRRLEATVVDPNTLEFVLPALQPGSFDITVTQGTERTTLRGGLSVEGGSTADADCSFNRIAFGYNSASLADKTALDRDMPCYQQRSGTIRITGHADERGTTDYNLVLGQRRADTVRRYLVDHGVSTGRIQTVSFGEEQPIDRGGNEAAWQKNRRAEVESR